MTMAPLFASSDADDDDTESYFKEAQNSLSCSLGYWYTRIRYNFVRVKTHIGLQPFEVKKNTAESYQVRSTTASTH